MQLFPFRYLYTILCPLQGKTLVKKPVVLNVYKQKTPRLWGLMLICFYGLKIGATYLPLISFFPKKCYNISCLIMGYRHAFRNRILLSLSIINRLRPCLISLVSCLISLVFVFILIPILLFHKNHLDVVPTYKFPNS